METKFAVIFTSQLHTADEAAYAIAAQRMIELAKGQDGFLGVDSVQNTTSLGITVSYWSSIKAIQQWKTNAEHFAVQKLGKQKWYQSFNIKICRIERETEFTGKAPHG